MAEKKAVPTFDGIMHDLKNGDFAPIYILMGDESYYIDQISNYIQNNVLPADQQAFDQTVVFGADVSASQIADLAMQFPMMAPARHYCEGSSGLALARQVRALCTKAAVENVARHLL